MRTTLDIETPVLDELKRLRRGSGRTLGQLASSLLAEAMGNRAGRGGAPAAPDALKWNTQAMGARVDLRDKDALYRAMEET